MVKAVPGNSAHSLTMAKAGARVNVLARREQGHGKQLSTQIADGKD